MSIEPAYRFPDGTLEALLEFHRPGIRDPETARVAVANTVRALVVTGWGADRVLDLCNNIADLAPTAYEIKAIQAVEPEGRPYGNQKNG